MTVGLGVSIGTVNTVCAIDTAESGKNARGRRRGAAGGSGGRTRASGPRSALSQQRTAPGTWRTTLTFDSSGTARVGRIPRHGRAVTDFADLTEPGRTARVRHRSLSAADLVATVARTVVADVSAHVVATADTRNPETAVAVTHPVSYDEERVLELREALDAIGLSHAALVAEPVAAAAWLSVAHGPLLPGLALVYDLGGSGLTVTLVRVGAGTPDQPVIGEPLRSTAFGGRAFGAKMAAQDNWRAGESSVADSAITALRTAHIRESLDVVYECLGRARVTMADVDCVLVVGGAARPPEVAAVLAAALARPVIVAPDPERTIAEGAAIFARRAAESVRESEVAEAPERPEPPRMLRRRLTRVAVTVAVAAGGALFAATAVVGDEAGAQSMSAGIVHVQH
ncbi:Hsp70 family protein [Nocardia africana]|uniref:Heat shock protein 70 n=1 Tax=Nocardia africana TaxID=134964 RepID=A0A378X393_9NOCA|nr:Hsp70 family protein [Nocardia africana]MCC3311736.1 Hsp70 family protein [Nocardia africana]SUA46993.1 Heat shock protein 70 [Nocardia africana]